MHYDLEQKTKLNNIFLTLGKYPHACPSYKIISALAAFYNTSVQTNTTTATSLVPPKSSSKETHLLDMNS